MPSSSATTHLSVAALLKATLASLYVRRQSEDLVQGNGSLNELLAVMIVLDCAECRTTLGRGRGRLFFLATGIPEVRIGVLPMQAMSLLRSIAPRRPGNQWALTREPFDARIAQTAGLPAKQSRALTTVRGLLRRFAPRNDGSQTLRCPGVRRDDTSMCTGYSSYPAFAFSPLPRCRRLRRFRHCPRCRR